MRRVAASLLVGLGLASATLAWSAFAARSTVLDPGRSERIADVLVGQPVIRDAVADGLAAALEQSLPAGAPVGPAELAAVAHRALDDPRATAALRTAIVASHQRLVGRDGGPVHLDVSPVAAAGRDALLAARPELARTLPAAPSLTVDLPTERLPRLGRFAEEARSLAGLASLAALALVSLGMALTPGRPRALRRIGRFGLRAGAGWAVFGWAVPFALTRTGDPRLAALGALGVAAAGPMIAPAAALVAAGITVLLAARSWGVTIAGGGSAEPPLSPPPGRPSSARRGAGRPAPGPIAAATSTTTHPFEPRRRRAGGATRT